MTVRAEAATDRAYIVYFYIMISKILKNKALQKFAFRLLVVLVIFFGVKFTIGHEKGEALFDAASIFYFSSAFFLTMATWEFHDRLIKKELDKPGGLDLKRSLKTLGLGLLFVGPIAALIYYAGLYVFDDLCQILVEDKPLQFRVDWMRAMLFGFAIMVFNLLYFSVRQKKDLEVKMNALQKEILASKYKSLKNQISPHFLFNSLNTLTSLMYEDRDLASDFVTRLASSYRYILDNREEDLVSLEKEMNFLDSFVFMMDVRHKNAVVINIDVKVDARKYAIPTLSLQMLVENALKHNYYSKEKPLQIDISCIENDALVVRNTLRKRELDGETTKLGLKNIKKRYSFYTSKDVLVREGSDYFEVILPLLRLGQKELNLLSVS